MARGRRAGADRVRLAAHDAAAEVRRPRVSDDGKGAQCAHANRSRAPIEGCTGAELRGTLTTLMLPRTHTRAKPRTMRSAQLTLCAARTPMTPQAGWAAIQLWRAIAGGCTPCVKRSTHWCCRAACARCAGGKPQCCACGLCRQTGTASLARVSHTGTHILTHSHTHTSCPYPCAHIHDVCASRKRTSCAIL